MEINKIYQGDALEVLKTFPDKVFNCAITSPPYWSLRDYECEGQLGLEEMPEEYITKLFLILREVKRTLRKDGTLWLNINDTYYGGGFRGSKVSQQSKQSTNKGVNSGEHIKRHKKHPVLKKSDLCLIPQKLIIYLQEDGWYIRSDIIWHKTNPMPENCTNRPTHSYEHLFLLSKSEDYHYDQIFEPYVEGSDMEYRKALRCGRKYDTKRPYKDNQPLSYSSSSNPNVDEKVKNKRDVWTINNHSLGNEHIASFSEELITPCLIAGCPKDGIVLDPFMGSGTVAKVAVKNNRNYVGIELNLKYIKDIAEFRIKEAQTGIPAKELKNGQLTLYGEK